MKKLLTVVVPCYNSESCLARAVDSLLSGGERLEIVIVNDGSTDATPDIADDYARRYPRCVRVVHQPNSGHGGAIMAGLQAARGLFFRVVDSDDWVDPAALKRVLDAMEALDARGDAPDVFVTNYVFDKVGARHKHRVRYSGALPQNRVFGWLEIRRFRLGSFLMIHAVTFRTEMLRERDLALPEHTCYEDNLFVCLALARVEKLYYLDADLYHYLIGRPGQSTQHDVVMLRIDDQLRVNWEMIERVDLNGIREDKHRNYMMLHLELMTAATTSYCLASGRTENEAKLRALLSQIRRDRPQLYGWFCHGRLSRRPVGLMGEFPSRMEKRAVRLLYALARRYYGFN